MSRWEVLHDCRFSSVHKTDNRCAIVRGWRQALASGRNNKNKICVFATIGQRIVVNMGSDWFELKTSFVMARVWGLCRDTRASCSPERRSRSSIEPHSRPTASPISSAAFQQTLVAGDSPRLCSTKKSCGFKTENKLDDAQHKNVCNLPPYQWQLQDVGVGYPNTSSVHPKI